VPVGSTSVVAFGAVEPAALDVAAHRPDPGAVDEDVDPHEHGAEDAPKDRHVGIVRELPGTASGRDRNLTATARFRALLGPGRGRYLVDGSSSGDAC